MAAAPHARAWECDGQLRLVVLRAGVDAPPVPAGWEGLSLSEQFELQPNEAGRFAVLRALAQQSRFEGRSEEHTSELHSLMRISYAVFCLKKKKKNIKIKNRNIKRCKTENIHKRAEHEKKIDEKHYIVSNT